jgi:hypothetical protein
MRNIAVIVSVLASVFIFSCIQESGDRYYNPSFLNDSDSYYQDYPDETEVSEEDVAEYKWDVRFSFYGIINDGDAPMENIQLGSGSLIYLDDIGESITVNGRVFALRKNMTITSGHEVPLIQIFFGDDVPGEDGWVLFYVLQLEGSSVSKAETYYLNNDKLYRTRMLWQDNDIKEVCYDQEPYTHKGKVIIYTGNIRIGEDLRVEGNAMMKDMETIECRVLE